MTHRAGLLFVHLGVLLFGLAALVGKIVGVEPVAIVWWRNAFAAVALAVLVRVIEGRFARPRRPLALFLLGAVLAAHWVTFFAAMRISTVTTGLLGFATFPVVVALIEPLLVPGERFRWSALVLAVVATAGIALVVPSFDVADALTLGTLVGVVSGVLYAVVVTTNRRLVADTSALTLGLWQNAAAFVWLSPLELWRGVTVPSPEDLALLLLLGVVLTGIAHVVFVHGMQRVSARTASIIGLLEPVYGIAGAALVLAERPSLRTLAGGAIVLGAVALASLRRDPAGT